MTARPVIIGIAGGTGSGKTAIAHAIFDRVGRDRIEWIRAFDLAPHPDPLPERHLHPNGIAGGEREN